MSVWCCVYQVFLFAFWFRIYIHYLAGYLFLLVTLPLRYPTLPYSTPFFLAASLYLVRMP